MSINKNEAAPDKKAGIKGKQQLVFIGAELLMFFILIYVSAYQNWPQHDVIRYLVLIPIYQAGVYFGLVGGTLASLISVLLFAPLVPVDPAIKAMSYGIPTFIVMMAFMIFFGVYIGATLGSDYKTQNYVDGLSVAIMNIAREVEASEVMTKLAKESLALVDAMYAAALICSRTDAVAGEIVLIDSRNEKPEFQY